MFTATQTSPAFPITVAQLNGAFSPQSIVKAYEYVRLGKVVECVANNDFSNITGIVSGSHHSSYEQEISLYRSANKPIINGYCSCPVAHNCKHVAAIIIQLIQRSAPQNVVKTSPLDHWLKQLSSDDVDAIERGHELSKELIFVLGTDKLGAYVELRHTKIGKKGVLGKGTKITLTDFKSALPYWLTKADKQLVQWLQSAATHTGRLPLEGELGQFILPKLIATQRLFWENCREPLALCAPAKLVTQWQMLDNQDYQLQLVLDASESWELIATEPPIYMDLNRNQLGLITTPINGELLLKLLHMPSVATNKMTEVGLALSRYVPLPSLNLPVKIKLTEITCAVRPRLTFTSVTNLDGSLHPVAKLDFIYGTYAVSYPAKAEAITLISKGKSHANIHRQLTAEHEYLQQVLALGFRENTHFHTKEVNFSLGELPKSTEPWLAVIDNQVPELIEAGFEVVTSDEFSLNLYSPTLQLQIEEPTNDWFSLALSADINGAELDLIPLIKQWVNQYGEPKDNQTLVLETREGERLQVAAKQVKPLINIMLEFLHKSDEQVSLPISRVNVLNSLPLENVQVNYSERLGDLMTKLSTFSQIETVEPPQGLQAELRDYQCAGLNWLCFLKQYGFGGILADDMGLGKTLQTLAFIYREQQLRPANKTLIVCPTSLLGNWQREAARFTPDLQVQVLHGTKRKAQFENLEDADVIITSYPLIQRDSDFYLKQKFDLLVLDEAQHIKNAKAKVTQLLAAMTATMKLCLSGTPMENHLGELKSLMDFVLPGLLGDSKSFNQYFKQAIEKDGDTQRAQQLGQRIAPFLLRRTKQQVASELPEKTEIVCYLALEKDQRNLYESIRVLMEKRVRLLFAEKGMAKSHIEVLDALLKLRQACCDPRLVKLEQAQQVHSNAKLAWLQQHLPEMIEEGRKILIFSQFTSMLDHIEDWLHVADIRYSKLTGKTKLRQDEIDKFQMGDSSVFLISLKAGGTGLNLTAADTVIHFDPWWNPAAERQATDRAHRMGQEKPVFVYKLIAEDTVEEKIQLMQSQKQGLADSILTEDNLGLWQGDRSDLLALFN